MTAASNRKRTSAAGLRVSVTDGEGRRLATGAASGLAAWLRRSAPRQARGHVAIALVSDKNMRQLNRLHRSVDRPTDVLSFPAGKWSAPRAKTTPGEAMFLGDLAIARGIAATQAREAGHPLRVEVRVLALHGLLHLLGYDHETDNGAMARVEDRLRRRAGLPAGLIGRAARTRRSRH